MKNKFNLGFSMIELVIALAIVAIIGNVAYSSYVGSLTRSNEETAKHKLVNLMQEMEKYYTIHGAYSDSTGAWSTAVSQAVTSLNANSKELYTYTIYPLEPVGNEQTTCINATPRSNTIQSSNSQLWIDEQNNIAINSVIQTKCSSVLTPTVVNPVIDACFNVDGTQKAYTSGSDCKGKKDCDPNVCKGNCAGATVSACNSGNCAGSKSCGPSTLGCNGNCQDSFVYNAPCGGTCDGSTVYIGSGSTIAYACSGNCQDVKIIAPKSWETREMSCSTDSVANCICKGSCAGLSVTFY